MRKNLEDEIVISFKKTKQNNMNGGNMSFFFQLWSYFRQYFAMKSKFLEETDTFKKKGREGNFHRRMAKR